MGLLHREVSFITATPEINLIIGKLRDITGLEITFQELPKEEEGGEIFCNDINQAYHLDISAENDNYTWYLFTTDLGASYLLDSTVFILISLGGIWPYKLPDWAGLPWEAAKEHF